MLVLSVHCMGGVGVTASGCGGDGVGPGLGGWRRKGGVGGGAEVLAGWGCAHAGRRRPPGAAPRRALVLRLSNCDWVGCGLRLLTAEWTGWLGGGGGVPGGWCAGGCRCRGCEAGGAAAQKAAAQKAKLSRSAVGMRARGSSATPPMPAGMRGWQRPPSSSCPLPCSLPSQPRLAAAERDTEAEEALGAAAGAGGTAAPEHLPSSMLQRGGGRGGGQGEQVLPCAPAAWVTSAAELQHTMQHWCGGSNTKQAAAALHTENARPT